MKLYEYQMSNSFTDLGPNLSDLIFLNFFPSITTRPIKARFHVEPPWDGRKKACSNDPGLITNMAAMPIYGKNLLKSSSLEPKGQWNVVCSIEYSSTTKFVQVMPILRQGQIWSPMLLYAKKLKQWISIFLNFFSSITADFNISSALRWAIQDQWSFGFPFIEVWMKNQHAHFSMAG